MDALAVAASRPAPAARALLERVTLAAFGQRRKMLRSGLKPPGVAVPPLLSESGIAPTAQGRRDPRYRELQQA